MTRLVVIEPHADDAFLSLGGHIIRWRNEGFNVHIITVIPQTPKRAREAAQYAEFAGASWEEYKTTSTWGTLWEGDQQVILPLAMQHPEHIQVREAFEKANPWLWDKVWYYFDIPYSGKQKNSDRTRELSQGMRMVSYLQPGMLKFKPAVPIFKTQAKFFHFNPPEKLKMIPEIIIQRSR